MNDRYRFVKPAVRVVDHDVSSPREPAMRAGLDAAAAAHPREPGNRLPFMAIPQYGDYFAFAAMFALGAIVGAAYILSTRNVFFYQQFAPEMVMWACGHRFVYVLHKPPALLDFLFGRQNSFDCHALELVQGMPAAGFFVRKQFYLDGTVALLWRVFGVSYAALWPLVAVLHGAYAAGCFAFARLFFRRSLALPLAILATLSPVAISMLFALRDFAKAPFFLWCVVLAFLAIRATQPRRAIMFAALAGLVVGIGTGFRSDTLMLVPSGALILLIGGDSASSAWRVRALTLIAFVTLATLTASPITGLGRSGGDGILIMQGATDPFDRFLGVRSGPYSVGWAYLDELTLTDVAAALRPTQPDWDAREPAPGTGVSQAMTQSMGYVLSWAPLFAADLATHALKAAAWIAGFATLVAPGHRLLDPAGGLPPRVWFGEMLEPFYRLIASPVLPWVGAAGMLCLLLNVYARSRRECMALTITLALLLAYPGIQFSVRHLFHLEIVSWMALLSLALLPLRWRQLRAAMPAFTLWAAGGAAVVAAVYAALIVFQDRALPSRLADLLRLPRDPVPLQATSGPDGSTMLAIPLPDRYRALVAGPPDSMDIDLPGVGNQWDVRAAADRLLITLGGPGCPTAPFDLGFSYRKRSNVWQPLDRGMTVTAPADPAQRTLVLASAFYRPTQYLEALVLPPGHAACVQRIERIIGPNPLPLSFSAVLAPDSTHARWHQGFGSFAISHR